MVLLDDFGDIVLKTNDLCSAKDDCLRLKNALVNLGNTRNWETLTKRATAGKLDGVNVLLRPVSAESLENLVTTSTAPFVMRETSRAAQALNSPAPGGFLIASDEGSVLVNQPWPAVSLYDYPAHEQWGELRRLAGMLMHTPSMPKGSSPICLPTPTARSISTCTASRTAAACGAIWAHPAAAVDAGHGLPRRAGPASLSAPSPAYGRDSEILRKLPESGTAPSSDSQD
jgi:hypothetical protein